MICNVFLEAFYVDVCQSQRGGLWSVDSRLFTLLLKWQQLLNWSNMASAGEGKTLPHTDRKHKHTLILLTHGHPWCTETYTNTHIVSSTHLCSSKHKERHIPMYNERVTHDHKHVHTIACMCEFIDQSPNHTSRNSCTNLCIDKSKHKHSHICTVWKYRSGREADEQDTLPSALLVSVSRVSVIQEMDLSSDSTPGFLCHCSDVSQSVKAWPKSCNPKWLCAFPPTFPTNWLKDGKCFWDNCLFFPCHARPK